MALLTRDAILQAQDIETEDVSVPEWGGTVRVRGMTGTERDAFEAGVVALKGKKASMNMENFRAKLIAKTVIDENGKRLFNASHIKALGAKSATALQRVFDVAQRLSGFSDDDVEELAKN